MIKNQAGVPRLLTKAALLPMQMSIKNATGCNVLGIKPRDMVKNINIPAYFMIGDADKIVDPKKFENMYNNYGATDKRIVHYNFGHADSREKEVLTDVMNFLRLTYNQHSRVKLPTSGTYISQAKQNPSDYFASMMPNSQPKSKLRNPLLLTPLAPQHIQGDPQRRTSGYLEYNTPQPIFTRKKLERKSSNPYL